MKKTTLTLLFLLCCGLLRAQTPERIQAYVKPDGTRYIAQLSDNSIWWFARNNWQQLPKTGLPEKPVSFVEVYAKIAFALYETRVVCVLNDNTIWWFSDKNEAWEQVSAKGLPAGKNIRDFKAYAKTGSLGSSQTRFVAVLDDNSIWWFAPGEEWESVSLKDLPQGKQIRFLRTYQKAGTMGTDTRYVVQLDDNMLWWFDGKKWHELETKGMPAGKPFKQFEIFSKNNSQNMMMSQQGRMIAVLEDQSIWWLATNDRDKDWERLPDNRGLPAGYRIRSMECYVKNDGMTNEVRFMALLEDGSMWWYALRKGWAPVPTNGLPGKS